MIGSALLAGAAVREKPEPAAANADVIKKFLRKREWAFIRWAFNTRMHSTAKLKISGSQSAAATCSRTNSSPSCAVVTPHQQFLNLLSAPAPVLTLAPMQD